MSRMEANVESDKLRDIRDAVARGWRHAANQEMDVNLVNAITLEVAALQTTSASALKPGPCGREGHVNIHMKEVFHGPCELGHICIPEDHMHRVCILCAAEASAVARAKTEQWDYVRQFMGREAQQTIPPDDGSTFEDWFRDVAAKVRRDVLAVAIECCAKGDWLHTGEYIAEDIRRALNGPSEGL